ncbi:MAG: nucleotidyltransferase domain-containing protein, partial [bacterium]|nr:nucleotidyltransferase domain-containing protein [bacterium]
MDKLSGLPKENTYPGKGRIFKEPAFSMYRIDLISNLDQSTFRFNQHTVHSNEKHMVHNRNQILKAIAEHRDIIRSFGVSQLALFGSGARDERTKTSDLDFVVEFDKKSFDGYMDLKFYL